MKKKILLRCLFGAPIGLAISYAITIAISMIVNDGCYYAIDPGLISDFGTEMNAVLIQAVCSLLYGAACGGASAIWEMESWSLLKMTVVHLVVCSVAIFPIAYFMRWMPHNLTGVFLYFGIFFGIYLFIWIVQFWRMKKRIEQMNDKVRQRTTL